MAGAKLAADKKSAQAMTKLGIYRRFKLRMVVVRVCLVCVVCVWLFYLLFGAKSRVGFILYRWAPLASFRGFIIIPALTSL